MTLVLLGTQNNSFARLLHSIEDCIDNNILGGKVIVQAGYTNYKSEKMEIFDFISSENLGELLLEADLIITHGGVGSIINAIKVGKKVIAVPRLEKYNEHVNDHQIQIVENFNSQDYIIGINDVKMLPDAIKKSKTFNPKKFVSGTSNIINIISNYIDNN